MKELIEFLKSKGFVKQANILKKGKTELDLSANQIGDKGVIALTKAITLNIIPILY